MSRTKEALHVSIVQANLSLAEAVFGIKHSKLIEAHLHGDWKINAWENNQYPFDKLVSDATKTPTIVSSVQKSLEHTEKGRAGVIASARDTAIVRAVYGISDGIMRPKSQIARDQQITVTNICQRVKRTLITMRRPSALAHLYPVAELMLSAATESLGLDEESVMIWRTSLRLDDPSVQFHLVKSRRG